MQNARPSRRGKFSENSRNTGSWNYPGAYWLPRSQVSLSDNVVTVGLSYKFGAPEPVVAKY